MGSLTDCPPPLSFPQYDVVSRDLSLPVFPTTRLAHLHLLLSRSQVCPATTAYALKAAFPEAELVIVPDAGHSAKEAGTKKLLTEFADSFKEL